MGFIVDNLTTDSAAMVYFFTSLSSPILLNFNSLFFLLNLITIIKKTST